MSCLTSKYEVQWIANTIGSYENEKFDQVVKWINEEGKFLSEFNHEILDKTVCTNSSWCNNMLSRIRIVRAKYGLNLTFLRVSDMAPLWLREELYCEITLLIKIHCGAKSTASIVPKQCPVNEEFQEQVNEVDQFLAVMKLQLEERIPVTNSDWYHHKVGEARRLIDKCEAAFSLQSQIAGSSSVELLSLHEELRREKRLLISLRCADLMAANYISADYVLKDKFNGELQEAINEVNIFLLATRQELEEKILEKNFDWYCKKIEDARKLIVKNYPAAFGFLSQDVGRTEEKHLTSSLQHLRSQDVGSSSMNMPKAVSKAKVDDLGSTRQQYQIFLSFRGEDTRGGFTKNLYVAFKQEGFKVFFNEEGMESGDLIAQVLMETIENAKLSIIVLSQNYAESNWCLKELAKILECKQNKNQLVWPIFYKVELSDVRHQKNSYEKAMINQETKFGKDSEDVKQWRSSLSQIYDLKAAGYYQENRGYDEHDVIQKIVEMAWKIKDRL